MKLNELTAISPIDGRYREKVVALDQYFSEYALIRYRVQIEVEYFIALCRIPLPQLATFNPSLFPELRNCYLNFTENEAMKIKEIEMTTNHDVKAVEIYLRNCFDALNLSDYKEFIHFGLTSQDINNTAVPLSLKNAMNQLYYPAIDRLVDKMIDLSEELKDIAMIARTHGQPASPTRLGKELMVFVERIQKQLGLMYVIPYSAKFGGATGNFNAHTVAYPQVKWPEFANAFVNHTLELERSQTTTQIEHYDNLAAIFQNLMRINTIFIDFTRDIWTYISMEYFKQKIKEHEVGSSAMPHKVNPIDFENAEGNFGVANALFAHLAEKLPLSRLQRDLTDSTVLRNIGVPFAHTMIAMRSVSNGLSKLIVNQEAINKDLENNWAVIAEAIQTILRREKYPEPYEALKKLTRKNQKIDQQSLVAFIDSLDISDNIKEELKKITPYNYTGV